MRRLEIERELQINQRQVFATAPYSQKGSGWLKNAQDGIYTGGGDKLLLKPVQSGGAYTATFDIGLAS